MSDSHDRRIGGAPIAPTGRSARERNSDASAIAAAISEGQEQAYVAFQRRAWAADDDIPTKRHHLFTGVPYHQVLGETMARRASASSTAKPGEKAV